MLFIKGGNHIFLNIWHTIWIKSLHGFILETKHCWSLYFYDLSCKSFCVSTKVGQMWPFWLTYLTVESHRGKTHWLSLGKVFMLFTFLEGWIESLYQVLFCWYWLVKSTSTLIKAIYANLHCRECKGLSNVFCSQLLAHVLVCDT